MKNSLLLITCCLGMWACTRTVDPVNAPTPPTTTTPTVQTKTLLTGYEIIWGMDFLPNGDLIFGEKRGRMYRRSGETVTELTGLPTDINTSGQGGLLDIRVHPNYAANGWIYASYAASAAGTTNTQLNLVRFKLTENRLTDLQTIFRASATNQWKGHYGSRIEFDKSGLLYLSIGEGGPSTYGGVNSPNKNAQNVQTEWGKVHRMTDSGAIPADNPILPGNTAPTTVFSYGHRNPQGLITNPLTGDMWESEHSAKGGDEVNILKKGSNYGWPLVSYGINYDGTTISASPTMAGVENPIHTWTPSIGPCGLAFVTSDSLKSWKGNLLVGGLALNYLSRLELDGNKVVRESKLLDGNRVRNVKQAPDGSIYVSVENPGRVLRLVLR
ncbi:PQQ-dependent sugar dehydrogenase [Fibrella sp. HMF5335]|uniref:PQQ-dependent sugar dehydrogenase n=1 Tax=Fibrella rubiginis TaxID=2817060 RepID=A0A939K4Q5_9BACT|nr:PQQ-dependent sugar dehydrogenase [Fibrella rubiginis]MBO0938664.1 PQQ-dependent sugar dehydrogenase [Fibrella rubiginis]